MLPGPATSVSRAAATPGRHPMTRRSPRVATPRTSMTRYLLMLRVRTIQWHDRWPQRWSKIRAPWSLQAASSDMSNCDINFDWWEVECPRSYPGQDARGLYTRPRTARGWRSRQGKVGRHRGVIVGHMPTERKQEMERSQSLRAYRTPSPRPLPLQLAPRIRAVVPRPSGSPAASPGSRKLGRQKFLPPCLGLHQLREEPAPKRDNLHRVRPGPKGQEPVSSGLHRRFGQDDD